MNPIPRNALVLYVGKRRSGKTTRLKHDLRQFHRYIVFDFKRQDFGGRSPTGVVVRGGVPQLEKAIKEGYTRIVFQVEPVQQRAIEQVNDICMWALQPGKGLRDFLLVFDEISFFMSKQRIPDGLEATINIGGGQGLGVWATAQMPQNVHNTFLEQSSVIFGHSLQGNAAEAIEKASAGNISASDLERLPAFSCMMWTDHEDPGDPCVFRLPPVPYQSG